MIRQHLTAAHCDGEGSLVPNMFTSRTTVALAKKATQLRAKLRREYEPGFTFGTVATLSDYPESYYSVLDNTVKAY